MGGLPTTTYLPCGEGSGPALSSEVKAFSLSPALPPPAFPSGGGGGGGRWGHHSHYPWVGKCLAGWPGLAWLTWPHLAWPGLAHLAPGSLSSSLYCTLLQNCGQPISFSGVGRQWLSRLKLSSFYSGCVCSSFPALSHWRKGGWRRKEGEYWWMTYVAYRKTHNKATHSSA